MNNKKKIYILFSIMMLFLLWKLQNIHKKDKEKEFIKTQTKILVGTYVFSHTCENKKIPNLEYRTCSLKINKDGTFQFNKNFNFIYDSIGIWTPREKKLYSWNKFTFNKKSYKVASQNINMDVGGMYEENDSLLQLNSITPKPNCMSYVTCFFMRKVKE